MLKSIFGLAESVATIALAPVEIVATVADAVAKPIAKGANEVVETVKGLSDDIRNL